jgi:hypothetical protein
VLCRVVLTVGVEAACFDAGTRAGGERIRRKEANGRGKARRSAPVELYESNCRVVLQSTPHVRAPRALHPAHGAAAQPHGLLPMAPCCMCGLRRLTSKRPHHWPPRSLPAPCPSSRRPTYMRVPWLSPNQAAGALLQVLSPTNSSIQWAKTSQALHALLARCLAVNLVTHGQTWSTWPSRAEAGATEAVAPRARHVLAPSAR